MSAVICEELKQVASLRPRSQQTAIDGNCCASSGVASHAASSFPVRAATPQGSLGRNQRRWLGWLARGYSVPLCGEQMGLGSPGPSPSSSSVAGHLHLCRAESDSALGAVCPWCSHWLCGLAQSSHENFICGQIPILLRTNSLSFFFLAV